MPTQIQTTEDSAAGWAESLKRSIRSGRELLSVLGLPSELASLTAERDFPVLVSREYVSRMQPGNPRDPLLMQVLGAAEESQQWHRGLTDPVGDLQAEILPGLLKKYARRALLITSGACAVHCRYCFRRNFPYQTVPIGPAAWKAAVESIRNDTSLDEVILSGGDPLSVRDSSLEWLIRSLDSVPHLRRIRVHTRFPVLIPSRVCQSLLNWVSCARCAIYFVMHFNHAAEIDESVRQAMQRLRKAGATLLNQAVLLRGVNDNPTAQLDLCRSLVDLHVLPYYLHQLDPVRGGLHFEVDDAAAIALIDEMRKSLPGYAVPQLVREIAGQPHKTPVSVAV